MLRAGLVCLFVLSLSPCQGQEEIVDSPMYHSPELPTVRRVESYVDATELWLKALARPNAELKCQAADAIALAHRRGLKGLERTVAPLREAFEQPDQSPAVRLAAARALVALEARAAAPSLFRLAEQGDGDLREVIDPALARWDYRPARAVWLQRLRAPETPRRARVLAIQTLAVVGEEGAVEPLRAIVLSARQPGPLRVEAAAALGLLRREGLEKDAGVLAADASAPGLPGRLAAVSLLRRHRGAEAGRVLQRLADDRASAVAAPAVARLLETNPALVLPALPRLLARPDARLRSLAAESIRLLPTEQRVHLLRDRLGDAHPDVRIRVREVLQELAAKKGFRKQVIEDATAVLAGGRWQGLEQATILLARLDHKPAGERLVKLLRFDRPEVCITAAWGLRKLAAPRTLEAVTAYVREKQRRLRATAALLNPSFPVFDHQLSQLNQLLGQQKYAPAREVLEEFIPRMEKPMRTPVCPESRAAAIWALGLLHEGKSMPGLARALMERLNDLGPILPEDHRVRRMAAVTLGRIKAATALATLRKYCPDYKPSLDSMSNAAGWAIERITGKPMPPPQTIRVLRRDGFLSSLD